MAITRINNNQITDSVAGNLYLGVNAAVKVQDYTITAGKIANNLTYGSDLTITGNLTVQGNTTAIDTINLVVEDPLILLAKEQTGSPALDIGFIGKRGTEDNIAWVWDESADQFVAVFTTSEVTNSTITINSYASVQVLDITAANANITGNLTFSGTILGNVTVSGNVDANNFNATAAVTAGTTITATGNVTGGNLTTAGDVTTATVTASGNVSGGNLVTAGDVTTATVTASGNIDGANVNATTNVTATTVTASGNVDAGTAVNANLIAGTSVQIVSTGDLDLEPSGNISASGRLIRDVGDPELAQDAATKQYVDDAVSAGIHIHTPVDVETPVALPAATYNQGGTQATVTDTIAGNTVVFSAAIDPQVNDQLWFTNSFEGIVANIAYFVVSAPNTSAAVLTTQYNGSPVSNITSNTGLSQSVRVNSGYGANLTANATGALTVDGYSVAAGNRVLVYNQSNAVENGIYVVTDAGNGSASWVLTRSDDANSYIPDSPTGLDEGSYVYVKFGDTGAGESYVMTQPQGAFNIGQAAVTFTQFSASQVYSANTSAGLVLNGTVFSAKVDNETTAFDGGGNISVKASANLTTPNIGDATGNSLTLGGNGLLSATTVTATGNIGGANIDASAGITAGTTIVATGNVTGGNLTTAGDVTTATVTASGNISGGNIAITGEADLGNIRITGNDITNFASNIITINEAGSDIDVRIEGSGEANLLVVDAGTDTVNIGTATATTGAALKVGTTDSMMVPVGNTLQRPGTPEIGMFRFNTGGDALEVYTSSGWEDVGVPAFTVIVADAFVGDGSTLQFTLSANSTTAGTIVSINGIVQEPTTAYSVSSTTLTFTEAPAVSDNIDARILTTTTTVTNIENISGNAVVEVLESADTVQITGNLLPSANITYNLGSDTARWNDIYLANSTIYLGNAQISANATSITFTDPEGNATVIGGTSAAISVSEIIKVGSNGVGNIGAADSTFNTIFAKATSAQYADLAEMYEADAVYEPGTVLCFGGVKEVTLCGQADSTRVAGVVSTNPSYLMNSGQTGDCVVAVALTGRVPCRVTGTVRKGDLMVSTGDGRARANNAAAVGTVIGKALADFDGADGVIEVVVGRV